jgi:hypothetical protein
MCQHTLHFYVEGRQTACAQSAVHFTEPIPICGKFDDRVAGYTGNGMVNLGVDRERYFPQRLEKRLKELGFDGYLYRNKLAFARG